jgi:predicted SprT family Zn-dependent metalloprotease
MHGGANLNKRKVKAKVVKMTREYIEKMYGEDKYQDLMIKFNDRFRERLGCFCWTGRKFEIEYSTSYVLNNHDNDEALKSVIVHEVAHIKYREHDKNFERMCKNFGVDPHGHPDMAKIPKKQFVIHCESCGFHRERCYDTSPERRLKRCPQCNSGDIHYRKSLGSWYYYVADDDNVTS